MSFLKLLLRSCLATALLAIAYHGLGMASTVSAPKQHVLIKIERRHGVEWTKVFRDGNAWACQSDILPYFESKKDPLAGLSWDEIKSLAGKPNSSCESRLTVVDLRIAHPIRIQGCMGNPKLDQWIATVHDLCGRR